RKDLIVGSSDGKIYYFQNEGRDDMPTFRFKRRLKGIDVGKNSSPFVCDWNEDGRKDLIVGSSDGKIYYFQNEGGNEKPTFLYKRKIKVRTTNEEGNRDLDVCTNSCPFVIDWNRDGRKDLIISSVESSRPKYPIDDPCIKRDVLRNIRYAIRNCVPIMPHLYVYRGMTREEKKRELIWHKEVFKNLDIPWTKTTGIGYHRWDIHSVPIWQSLWVEKDFGLLYDFGFEANEDLNSPSYGMPFLLMNKGHVYPFICWTPNPRIDTFKGAFDLQVHFDLPINYHNHQEHMGKATKYFHLPSTIKAMILAGVRRLGINIETRNLKDIGLSLRKIITSLNTLRDRHEYNMNTQEQIAKTIINTYFTNVKTEIYKDKLVLIPDVSQVPKDKAKEYLNTLGVKIELKDSEEGKGIETDSKIYYEPEKGILYIGVDKKTTIYLNKNPKDRFHVLRSNVPFRLKEFKDGYRIKLLSPGMQQIKIYSKKRLFLKNKEVILEKKGGYYELIHFGKPIEVILTKGR
ncbi:MAG: VCBS repeat-containing protein, partial [bacterium]|nr:VCBS repeat-containing protein [bacterium]